MNKFKKYFIITYISIFILVAVTIANLFILPSSNILYKYVPAASDIVVEVNVLNFINEVGYQWIYQPSHFDSENYIDDTRSSMSPFEFGINPVGKIIIFNEKWADESLWFAIVEITDEDDFNSYLIETLPHAIASFGESVAVVQLSASKNQSDVNEHVGNILSNRVNSIESNLVVRQEFSNDHEINIYLKSLKSDYVTDGYLNINFNNSQIDIEGYLHPIGKAEIEPIAYRTEPDIGFSLRSSLNLLNKIYLFNETKLDNLPDYKQIALDYDGVNFLTNNDVIPVTSFPNINLSLDIDDEKTWLKYIDASVDDGSLLISNDTIMINSEVKAKLKYQIANSKFVLFQQQKTFEKTKDLNETFFDLRIHPQQIVEKMAFREDQNNPPKLVASSIIKIVRSILDDFTYLKAIKEINFSIVKDENSNDFLSAGHLIFENRDSHSTIEAYFIVQNFLQTIGSIIR